MIKIDRSPVADIDREAPRLGLRHRGGADGALELGARVIAEGVDTVQRYLLARPSTDPAGWARWPAGTGWRAPAPTGAPRERAARREVRRAVAGLIVLGTAAGAVS